MFPVLASALFDPALSLPTIPLEQLLIERPVPVGHLPRRCDATSVRGAVLADEGAVAAWKTATRDEVYPAELRADVDAVLSSLRCTTLSAAAPLEDVWPLSHLGQVGVGLSKRELEAGQPLEAARLALDLFALGQDLQYGTVVEKSVGAAVQLDALTVVEQALPMLGADGRAEVADRALALAARRSPLDLRVEEIWYRTWTEGSWDPRLWWAMREVETAIETVNAASPGATPEELTAVVTELKARATSGWFPVHLSLGLLSVLEETLDTSTRANVRIAELAVLAQVEPGVTLNGGSACADAHVRTPVDPRTLSALAGATGSCVPARNAR